MIHRFANRETSFACCLLESKIKNCILGLQSVNNEQIDNKTLLIVKAGLQLSFKMSRHIMPCERKIQGRIILVHFWRFERRNLDRGNHELRRTKVTWYDFYYLLALLVKLPPFGAFLTDDSDDELGRVFHDAGQPNTCSLKRDRRGPSPSKMFRSIGNRRWLSARRLEIQGLSIFRSKMTFFGGWAGSTFLTIADPDPKKFASTDADLE
uniref:Uncharacterized protein n=1 Tax=Romanomermis culicivorax TaxID=13658 RepID=A0A915JJ28_ROMCU